MLTNTLDFIIPVLAGASFSVIGIAYQMGQRRKLSPLRVFLLLSLCGAVFFALKTVNVDWSSIPPRSLWFGTIAGFAQYYTMRLVGQATTLGPFSLIWCMLSLAFAPVALYAAMFQHIAQPLTVWLAVLLALGCCVLAATALPPTPTHKPHSPLAFGALLLTILVLNALPNVAIQDLNTTAAGSNFDPFFLCMYAAIAICSFIDAAIERELALTFKAGWLPGILAGFGSVCGMLGLAAGSARIGPPAFLITSMVTLIIPMIAAVTLFHERPSLRWATTLMLAVAAILLSSL